MFTSRAEYRLILREDNADMRLTEKGRKLGIVSDLLWKKYQDKRDTTTQEILRLKKDKLKPNTPEAKKIKEQTGESVSKNISLFEMLKRPKVLHSHLPQGEITLAPNAVDEIEASVKYEGYIKRQKMHIDSLQSSENTRLPGHIR